MLCFALFFLLIDYFLHTTTDQESTDDIEMKESKPLPKTPSKNIVTKSISPEPQSSSPSSSLTPGSPKVLDYGHSPIKEEPFYNPSFDENSIKAEIKMKDFKSPPLSPTSKSYISSTKSPIKKAPVKLPELDLSSKSFYFYWIDAVGDISAAYPGVVFLFGKLAYKNETYNCTVRVKSIIRKLYCVPKKTSLFLLL